MINAVFQNTDWKIPVLKKRKKLVIVTYKIQIVNRLTLFIIF